MWVGIALAALQQLVGINVIFYYSSTLWQAVGFGADRSLISVVSALVNIVGTFVAIAVIDRVGRKPLLLVGSAGMAISLGTAAFCFHSATVTKNEIGESVATLTGANATIALIGANAFVFFFALSWGPVVWVLISEMFPTACVLQQSDCDRHQLGSQLPGVLDVPGTGRLESVVHLRPATPSWQRCHCSSSCDS